MMAKRSRVYTEAQKAARLYGRNAGASNAIYRQLRDQGYPDDYTILCFNCNIARSLFGRCPHTKETP